MPELLGRQGNGRADLGPRRALAAAAATVLLVAGCNSNGNEQTPPTAETTPAATASAGATEASTPRPTPPQAVCELRGGTKGEKSIRFDPQGFVRLSSFVGRTVNVGDHNTGKECYEQVTFRFTGDRTAKDQGPGIHARYVKPPIVADGSGLPVDVPGEAFLQVTTGSWWYGEQGGSGPKRLSAEELKKVNLIKQAVMIGNYEGMGTWAIGLPEERDFTLSEVRGTPGCPDMCAVIRFEDRE